MTESTIVSAVGTISISNPLTKDIGLSKTIEKAMSDAVIECYANGITDPDAMRAAMMQARDKAKGEFFAALLTK